MVEANLQSDNCKDLAIGQTPKIGGMFLMKMFFLNLVGYIIMSS